MSLVSSLRKAFIAAILAGLLNAALAAVNISQYIPRTQFPFVTQIIGQLESGKKFEILEAPTGMGKSAVGYTLGRHFESYYYITAYRRGRYRRILRRDVRAS